MIRVGKISYDKTNKKHQKIIFPHYENFTPIIVMEFSDNSRTKSEYWPLSPYVLVDEKNRIMENVYQFSKIYKTVPKIKTKNYDKTIMWSHDEETHIDENGGAAMVTDEYWKWREKGMANPYPVRYPVGREHRVNCQYAIPEFDPTLKLNYIQTRCLIYLSEFSRLARQHELFKDLRERLLNGEKLLIIEVDGPHQESMDYYKENYGVDDSFIKDNTMLVTKENLTIMAKDTKHPFGHCYCLAMALLDLEDLAKSWC